MTVKRIKFSHFFIESLPETTMSETHDCLICAEKVTHSERYPRQVCERCATRAADAYGRRLKFFNESISGGLRAVYLDNGAEYNRQICYIDGIKCYADEHRFGGIVIQVLKD